MTKNELIKDIDKESYKKVCEQAIKYAATTGAELDTSKMFSSVIPHDISDQLWDLNLPVNQLISICFDLYEDMPCYAYLMYLKMWFNGFPKNEQYTVIDRFYDYLCINNATLSKPIEYSLWCDYFEDDEVADIVWNRLLSRGFDNKILIKKILEVSGPVKFQLKEALYEHVISNNKLHYSIFKSLMSSKFDICGKIDNRRAKVILNTLDIDKTTEEYQRLLSDLQ